MLDAPLWIAQYTSIYLQCMYTVCVFLCSLSKMWNVLETYKLHVFWYINLSFVVLLTLHLSFTLVSMEHLIKLIYKLSHPPTLKHTFTYLYEVYLFIYFFCWYCNLYHGVCTNTPFIYTSSGGYPRRSSEKHGAKLLKKHGVRCSEPFTYRCPSGAIAG